MAELARVAASAAERASCEARYAAACAAAAAAGAPAPFRGPAADSPLGERFLDVVALVSANGFALDARPARHLCGLTFRLGVRHADGSLNRAGFRGGSADVIDCALRLQAPWLEAARRAQRVPRHPQQWFEAGRSTSLMRAVDVGDEQRARELLAAGAPFLCVDHESGRTALHWACVRFRNRARVVEALLGAYDASGATVDVLDKQGCTPLLLASHCGFHGIVRALLAHGARQELQDKSGKTALHYAAERGHIGVVELLCDAPGAAAALEMRDKKGRTPLALAEERGRRAAADVLRARGAS